MNFKEEFEKKVENIERIIRDYLPEETGYQKTVLEAMNYSVLAGGKRLRPMLMGETFCLFDGKNEKEIEPFMAAIEMIHTYSLVHDDLPAMDDDEYRRGRKTTHVVFGEAIGILAGDGLLNFAYETACKAYQYSFNDENLDTLDDQMLLERLKHSNRIMKAMNVLAKKPGVYGMLGGQVIDVQATGHAIERDRLDVIYEWKTGALIEASMMIGAILAGASDLEVEVVRKIALSIGLAFQIQDDILDETSTMQVLGKPIHSDEKNEKTTYVTLFGLDKAKEFVEELSNQAIEQYQSLNKKNEYLEKLIYYLIDREK
ncbi:geranylgeranyl diphosphate synthase, type II [Anaerosporobacter mobilis DSM 15930]|jgi:geranylgeranyl diphosphate synthase type II|uniref:Farnesyl diphosphate synthase n=1 Tax=Anaerosporobacter mobilis DSM 15930 TaxID=1120996 RepID=A0A1M7M239_9FIRM|nr:farnesyl diphosphate synthase [Anaerosporobacter mobilis]SHM84744.1 geranylgeranyl diphosphate synthase, type II [Anaerosporobacter mobilis DSM 15930]